MTSRNCSGCQIAGRLAAKISEGRVIRARPVAARSSRPPAGYGSESSGRSLQIQHGQQFFQISPVRLLVVQRHREQGAVGHTPKSKTLDEVYLHPKANQMIEAFDSANQLVKDEVLALPEE